MSSPERLVVHAFARDGAGGNPAGVVLGADALTREQKQAIAAEIGVPETAFVSRSATATRRLEFFTPNRQIAHCGHATVAAFGLLHQRGELADGEHVKESIDGPRTVRIDAGQVFLRLPGPRLLDPRGSRREWAALLSLPHEHLLADDAAIVDLGNRFLHIGVRDTAALRAIVPDQAAIEAVSEAHDLIGVYAYCRDTDAPRHVARTRMFAPRYGIPEEAATGMAAAGLAALLAERGQLHGDRGWIEQGDSMPRPSPSLLEVRIAREAGRMAAVWVGGVARLD